MYQPDFEELDKLVESGHLSKKISDCGKYKLYNYTDYCTFDKLWNDHTLNSRGTVYEIATGEVVARAFPKFFNLSELPLDKQKNILNRSDFHVFTKEDGSMITLAFYDGEWRSHTRGSFNSDQAIKAKELLKKYDISELNKNFTFLLEVIYPENKIVVNYGDREDLVLLAVINTQFGEEWLGSLEGCPFPIAKSHSFKSIQEVIDHTQTLDANNEGFVIRLSSGERVKLKSPEYLKIARIISRMSPLVLWESMVDGKVSQELLQSIPEEFRTDYEGYTTSLEGAYSSVYRNVAIRYNQVMATLGYTRKDELPDNIDSLRKPFALALQNDPNELNSAMWGVLLQKPAQLNKFIMDRIKPVGNVLNVDI